MSRGVTLLVLLAVANAFTVAQPPNERPQMTPKRTDVKPFEYIEAKVPFYPPSAKWGVIGKSITHMQLPLDATESMKHFVHPVDFELKLFASDPDIKRPICMNWDERGRLWIAETVDYPNERKLEGEGRDRIVICEDTDGDGRADKFTVFADKLSIPTGFAFAYGGVIVHQAPHTLFLRDTDGDDKADERIVLFTGWSTSDTHAGPSNLNYGLDGWYYGIVGYAGFYGTIAGERQSFRQGLYRFKVGRDDAGKVRVTKFEFLRNTNNNSWGVGISEEGILFGSTANGYPSVYMPIANRYYEKVRGWSSRVLDGIAEDAYFHPITDKVRQVDWHGKFTAAAGHALYTARAYPKQYWNRTAFVSDPTGHLTATFVIEPRGADFRSRNAWNLLAGDDEWSAPIMAEVGPDGNVWIIDWYNYIVQHNPTPPGYKTGRGAAYETPLRDKKHGRIYRLVHKSAKPAATVSLQDASPEKLVDTLRDENMFWRKHAQRLLIERGQHDVVPVLVKLTQEPAVDAIGLNPAVMHALWTLHGLRAMDGAHPEATGAAVAALRHRSAGVRRNALLCMPRKAESLKPIRESGVLSDPDAQVRLAAFLTLANMPAGPEVAKAVATALRHTANLEDRWLRDAGTAAAAQHDIHLLEALAVAKTTPPSRLLELVLIVSEHYARGDATASVGGLLVALSTAEPKLAETVVQGLSQGWPKDRRVQLSADVEGAMERLLERLTPAAKGRVVQLATRWGSQRFQKHAEEIGRALLASVLDEKQSDDQRATAAQELCAFRAEDALMLRKVVDAVSPRVSPELARGLIEALAASSSSEIATTLIQRYASWPPSARAAALRVLLSRPDHTRTLLGAMDSGKLSVADLSLDQKQALASHPDAKIARRAAKLLARTGGLPSPDRQKVVDELLPLIKKTGDAKLGKAVFVKHCAKCHVHSGEGTQIGPDLSGVAVHNKEHLLTDIMDPNRSVEGNFRVSVVTTNDGRVITGLLGSETRTSVELIDSEGKRHSVQRADIDELTVSAKSLMPEGFEKQLSAQELVDLLEFLSERGQYLPLPLGRVATAVSTRGMFNSPDSKAERLVFPDWKPRMFKGVPFNLVDPQDGRTPNVVLLYGPQGTIPPTMPKSVRLPCNSRAKAVHLLSGVSGWGWPGGQKGSVSLIVRLHYQGGETEDHPLKNGAHFADYIRRVDVPDSEFAFDLRGRQVRYLAIQPKRSETIAEIEFVKGDDRTAPVVMAVTVETR